MTRLARTTDGRPLLGDDTGFVPLSSADPSLTSVRDAFSLAVEGELPSPDEASASRIPRENLSFAAPIEQPGKLWGIGLNYADHASDLDEERPTAPASFMKPATAMTGPGGPIRLPPRGLSDHVTAEAELAVVIGRTCSDIDDADVDDVVAGYLPIIDMTAEDILKRNPRFLTRAKSFDSFLTIGAELVTTDEIDHLEGITVETVVNGEVAAKSEIRNMMTKPPELVSFHSKVMTLEPGDVISTGTPGARSIEADDHVTGRVEQIGSVSADVTR